MSSSRASTRDLAAGYVKIDENDLRKTGLRGKKLIVVIACLVVLWILAVITLICNVLLIVVLRMNHRGMESMQFMRTESDGEGAASEQHLVQFTGENTDLGKVVINSGVITGYKDQDFILTATKVILDSKDSKPASRLVLDQGNIRLENVKNFLVTSAPTPSPSSHPRGKDDDNENGGDNSRTPRLLFDAAKPTFRLRKSIKQLASAKVVANTIRALVTGNLSLTSSRSLTLHGTDKCVFEGESVHFRAQKAITFLVGSHGVLKLQGNGRGRTTIPTPSRLPVSEAPAIRADKLGLRVCVCKSTGRLFAAQGNARCRIPDAYCY